MKNTKDEFVIGSDCRLVHIKWDGKAEMAEKVKIIGEIAQKSVSSHAECRFNDAKADPQGRFYGGTMEVELNRGLFDSRLGVFYRFDGKDNKFVELKGNIGISNGLAWNEATGKMYYIDSIDLDIKEYDVDKHGNICKIIK